MRTAEGKSLWPGFSSSLVFFYLGGRSPKTWMSHFGTIRFWLFFFFFFFFFFFWQLGRKKNGSHRDFRQRKNLLRGPAQRTEFPLSREREGEEKNRTVRDSVITRTRRFFNYFWPFTGFDSNTSRLLHGILRRDVSSRLADPPPPLREEFFHRRIITGVRGYVLPGQSLAPQMDDSIPSMSK